MGWAWEVSSQTGSGAVAPLATSTRTQNLPPWVTRYETKKHEQATILGDEWRPRPGRIDPAAAFAHNHSRR